MLNGVKHLGADDYSFRSAAEILRKLRMTLSSCHGTLHDTRAEWHGRGEHRGDAGMSEWPR